MYNKFFLYPGRLNKLYLGIKNPPASMITIKYFRAFGQSVLFAMALKFVYFPPPP